jgi:hypothetical protein
VERLPLLTEEEVDDEEEEEEEENVSSVYSTYNWDVVIRIAKRLISIPILLKNCD